MSSGFVGSLMRRGMEVTVSRKGSGSGSEESHHIATWIMVMLGATTALFFVSMSLIDYTYGRVIPTLLMIESPDETIPFEPVPTEDHDNDGSLKKGPELEAVKPRLITSSLRSSVRLLKSKGGRRGVLRGLVLFVVTNILTNWVARATSFVPIVGPFAGPVIAAVLCANLSTAWTHIVITESSQKAWFRRLPSVSTWKKVAIPTALLAVAEEVAAFIPFFVAIFSGVLTTGPQRLDSISEHDAWMSLLKVFGIISLTLLLGLIVVLPANVALTRVQASVLPDSEETIVSFDRSFNGKVVPQIVGGSGVIGMLDAWKTFNFSARLRLIKTYVKVFMIQIALAFLFIATIIVQLSFFVAKKDDLKTMLESVWGFLRRN